MQKTLILPAVLVLALAGCATNPVTGEKELTLISEGTEISIGQENYVPSQQMQGGQYTVDPQLSEYVNSVGQKLAKVSDRPGLPYEFVVLNNSEPNAWALPGGKIAVNRGLLIELDNEAELAAVLGHEIVHAAARHGAKSMERGLLLQVGVMAVGAATSDNDFSDLIVGGASLGAGLIALKYGRGAELESDHYGIRYMAKAGYDPQAAVSLQEKFVKLAGDRKTNWLEGMFASHPPSQERVEENKKLVATLPAGGYLGREEYQRRIGHLKQTAAAYRQYDEGRKALAAKDAPKALQLAEQAIAAEPREALFYGLKGDALFQRNTLDAARSNYDQAIARNENFFHFWLQRGLVRKELGDTEGARTDLERSNALLPTAVAHNELGKLALDSGQRARAIEHFSLAAGSDSSSGREAAVNLARLDLPANPGRFIESGGALENGRVVVAVRNGAALAVRDVRLDVRVIDRKGRILGQQQVQITGPLASGRSARQPTPIGPFEPKAVAGIEVRVLSARLAE